MLNKITGQEVDRRLLLKGAAAGGLGIAGATMLAGCASDASGPVNFGVRTAEQLLASTRCGMHHSRDHLVPATRPLAPSFVSQAV